MGDLEKFTEFLYGDLTGYVYAPLKKKDNSWTPNFFQWPGQKDELHSFIQTHTREGDVYISPAIFSEKSSKKSAVKATRVAWVEFDGKTKDFGELPEPSMIVQSSTEDHLHCYWRIPETTVEVVEDINRRLTYHLQADSSGWDANQVLRPPTTLNWKFKLKPKEVKLQYISDVEVSFSTFDKAPPVRAPVEVISYDELLDPKEIKLLPALEDQIYKQMPVQGKRSSYLMSTGHLLAENDYSQLEIITLLYVVDCRIKKFVGRGDQLQRLSEIASIALSKIEEENYVQSYSPLEIVNHELSLEMVIPGWLHSRGQMILSGAPGVGKTQFSLDLAYRLSVGQTILGKTPALPQKVAVISLEMDVVELKYIFERQAKGFDNLKLWNENVKIYSFDEGSLTAFEKVLQESKPNIVIIDSLSEMSNEDLKEAEARAIMRWFKKMRRTYGCAFIVIHHNRKANDNNKKPRKLSDLYGSFVFAKLSETVVSLWQDEGKEVIELDVLKARFGDKPTTSLLRTEHLTFRLVESGEKVSVGEPIHNPLLDFGDEVRN